MGQILMGFNRAIAYQADDGLALYRLFFLFLWKQELDFDQACEASENINCFVSDASIMRNY